MFLIALSHNIWNRFVKRRFNHSTQTIHRYFYEVLHAMLNFSKEMIVDTRYDQLAHQIRENCRIRHIFQGAVVALDGTLISAVVPHDQQIPYRGLGRGECYQNVLSIYDFDMLFTFVWAGWEGVAHDSWVLRETMSDPANNFPILPPDKFLDEFNDPNAFYSNAQHHVDNFEAGGGSIQADQIFMLTLREQIAMRLNAINYS
ncbi:hypothetical protein RHSIM_Rhsim04G0146200 [Rhododendron simsii]|uniref:DUF8040 domain-containing protein n=1 Tax=Rhododendron simsii TaxID=118357 RepID=A0A834LR68_RHOSS|nr:hypothetical protein RHSIM_Rhsim04G0146200 [Rhododendron simsii]